MKPKIYLILLPLLMLSCTDEAFQEVNSNSDLSTNYELRTETEAIAIARKAFKEFYPRASRSERDFSGINVVKIQKTLSRNAETSNPLYVVNFGDESGYAIVSGNRDVTPLLAVTESGSISDVNDIDNPGLELFVDNALSLEVDSMAVVVPPIIDDGSQMVTIYRNDTIFHTNTVVDPRISVKWGQTYPEGELCPNGVCGCVATAGAQALSYFEYPGNVILTFPERQSDIICLDWAKMKEINSTNFWRQDGIYDVQLSSLCREIGYSIDAIYYDNGNIFLNSTSASSATLRTYFRNLLPTDQFIVSEMCASNPKTNEVLGNGIIIIRAASEDIDGTQVGHAWVIDGYKYKKYTVYVYARESNSAIETLERQFDQEELYSHVNWGWNGADNGYFYNNIFRVGDYNFNINIYYFSIKTK